MYGEDDEAMNSTIKVEKITNNPIFGSVIHQESHKVILINLLLPSGVMDFSVFVPPIVGGSEIVKVRYKLPCALCSGKSLFQ